MSSQSLPDVIPLIKKWLESNSSKIENFWIGADWRNWARYEIYHLLDQALGNECLVTHDINFWEKSNEGMDILIEPRDSDKMMSLAIRLRCEKVNENEGSFERFSEQYQKDWKMLQDLSKNVESDFDGTTILLLGFSGEEMGEEGFGVELNPEKFNSQNVYGWCMYHGASVSS